MQHDITKLCAGSLRSYLHDKHGIQLKSGHAHEIVAAFFGYKSKIALLADKQYPLSNLEKAEFILLNPPTPFVDQRLKNLEGLSPDLPPSHILAEAIYSIITNNKELSGKVQPTFDDLAITLADARLYEHIRHWRMTPMPQWITEITLGETEAEVSLAVIYYYPLDAGNRSRYCKVDIKLSRIAGNIGYGTPEVMLTSYSGQFHDPDYNPDFGMTSGGQL